MLNSNAQKWVNALRSGKYEQGKSYLRAKNGNKEQFCCLGVACEIFREEIGGSWKPNGGGTMAFVPSNTRIFHGQMIDAVLPHPVMQWFKLRLYDGMFGRTSLAELNDQENYTFNQIADVIESEPEGLFSKN